jgi:hypothetical protein
MVLSPVFSESWAEVYAFFALGGFILGWVAQRGNYCFVNAMTSILQLEVLKDSGHFLYFSDFRP